MHIKALSAYRGNIPSFRSTKKNDNNSDDNVENKPKEEKNSFFDKILLKNFAYESAKYGIKGLLTNIKVAKIITTAEAPKFLLHISGFGFTIKKANQKSQYIEYLTFKIQIFVPTKNPPPKKNDF